MEQEDLVITLIWRCLNCGYLHHDKAQPPEHCPECNVPKEEFELFEED